MTKPDDTVANGLNTLPKHVATSRPDTLGWENSHPMVGDVLDGIRSLKERPGGELQVHGSHKLLQTLLKAGLVDEFNVWTFPVVLGRGKRLFGEGAVPTALRHTSTEVTRSGIVVSNYAVGGSVVQQSAVVKDGTVVIE